MSRVPRLEENQLNFSGSQAWDLGAVSVLVGSFLLHPVPSCLANSLSLALASVKGGIHTLGTQDPGKHMH